MNGNLHPTKKGDSDSDTDTSELNQCFGCGHNSEEHTHKFCQKLKNGEICGEVYRYCKECQEQCAECEENHDDD